MRGAVLCAALALVPASVGAQSISLTEREAVMRMSAEGARVRAARAPIEVERAAVLGAARWPNPRASMERQAVAGVTEYYTSVTQILPITGRRGFDVQAATARVSARSSRADEEVRRLRADLRLAFADLVAAQARVEELVSARDRLRSLSAVLATRESAGDVAGFDRLRAERQVLDVESDLAVASTEQAIAQARLAGFFDDRVEPAQIVAAGGKAAQAEVPPLEVLLTLAETARGDLAAFQHEIEAARLSARAADRRALPEPEIFAGTKSSTAGTDDGGRAVTVGSGAIGPLVGIQFTIPLFDRAKPERALAAAREVEAEAKASALRAALRGEVGALRAAVIERRAVSARYRADSLRSAGELERIAQVSYDAGERGILELLDAFRITAEARLRQAALDLAARRAEIELEFTTGWELPL